jgi:ParB/RepB/Spo0J family partition protein
MTAAVQKQLVRLRISDVRPDYEQPRQEFDQEKLEELAASMRARGQLEPVHVRPVTPTNEMPARYALISGERRWRALQMIGADWIEAIIGEPCSDDDANFERACAANGARDDLSPSDNAAAVARLAAMPKYQARTQTERVQKLAAVMGKSTTWVSDMLKLDGVAPEVKRLVDGGALSKETAVEVAAIRSPERQAEVSMRIAAAGLRVPEANKAVRQAAAVEQAREDAAPRPGKPRGTRSPRADQKLVEQLISRATEAAEQALDMPAPQLARAYGSDRMGRQAVLQRLDAGISALRQLRQALARVGADAPRGGRS